MSTPQTSTLAFIHLPAAQRPAPLVLDGIVYLTDLARWLQVSRTTIWRWLKKEDETAIQVDLPTPRRLGQNAFWPAHIIAAWAQAKGMELKPSEPTGRVHHCEE